MYLACFVVSDDTKRGKGEDICHSLLRKGQKMPQQKLPLSKPWITVQCDCILEETLHLVLEKMKFKICLVLLL